MVHIHCRMHEIKEVSNGTAYHNKKFKEIAKVHGLTCLHGGRWPKVPEIKGFSDKKKRTAIL
mgnify:CR=1 FL=1